MAASFMARVVLTLVLSLWLLPSLLPGSLAAGASSAGNELNLPLSGGSSRRTAMVRSRERQDGYGLSMVKSARRSLRPTPAYEHNPGDQRNPPVSPARKGN
uniref:Uncharacterized protein n=1 Tax=Oryza punctata TaxID=4537 RepID=A0A0E0JX99_ORYPU